MVDDKAMELTKKLFYTCFSIIVIGLFAWFTMKYGQLSTIVSILCLLPITIFSAILNYKVWSDK